MPRSQPIPPEAPTRIAGAAEVPTLAHTFDPPIVIHCPCPRLPRAGGRARSFFAGAAVAYVAAAVVFFGVISTAQPHLSASTRGALAATWPTSFGRYLIPEPAEAPDTGTEP